MTWEYAQTAHTPPVEATPNPRQRLMWVAITLLVFVAGGVLAAYAWSRLAHPPGFTVSAGGASMDEQAAGQQFGIEVTYAWICAVGGLVLGSVLAVFYHRLGWLQVAATAVGSGLAALLTSVLGKAWGPPDPGGQLAHAVNGQVIPIQLSVKAEGFWLMWSISALIGLIAVVATHRQATAAPLAAPADEHHPAAPAHPARDSA
ncbi:MAG: hypothetical protein ACRDP1_09490 [Nocardioidaceae bacterium]